MSKPDLYTGAKTKAAVDGPPDPGTIVRSGPAMTPFQRIVLVLGLVVCAGIGLYPPWEYERVYESRTFRGEILRAERTRSSYAHRCGHRRPRWCWVALERAGLRAGGGPHQW